MDNPSTQIHETAATESTYSTDQATDQTSTPSPQRLEIGETVPDFTVKATANKNLQLSACADYALVLFFYPKDNTPGCTLEAQDFKTLYPEFKALKTCVFGVSRDSLASHEKFKAKFDFPFELIADQDQTLCNLFDVIQLKNLYGREVLGIERSSFLIDGQGVLRNAWRKVKVEHHAHKVLDAARQLA